MGSLAGLLKSAGYTVSGSDQNIYPPMSTALEALGIPILNGFSAEHLTWKPDLVIIGNAVSKNNPEVEATLASGIPYLSLPEAIGHFFLETRKSIVITGTHGKTTTTALTAWLLEHAAVSPSFLVGGVLNNFSASYQLKDTPYFVIEGDEYDTAFFDKGPKFYHYRPFIAAITSLEFDHADIFPNLETIETHFKRFSELLPKEGTLFVCSHYANLKALTRESKATRLFYGLHGDEDISATNIIHTSSGTTFTLLFKGVDTGTWTLPMSGEHNLLNALVAIGIAKTVGLSNAAIQSGLSTFKSVKRRQEVRGSVRDITVIDDFAHHPTAVRETLSAIRKRDPNRRLWAIFEPRSNSSIRAVFESDYAASFKAADRVVFAPVFRPEKVKDGAILNIDTLVEKINQTSETPKATACHSVEDIITLLTKEAQPNDTLVIMSNGGFDNIHDRLLIALNR